MIRKLQIRMSGNLWTLPTLFTISAALLAVGTLWLDHMFEDRDLFLWSFPGDGDSARSLLSTIAAAMINFLALVFTITIVVLQLASNQFTPRLLRTFLQDQVGQLVLASFVATFTYSVVVLRTIDVVDADGSFVPTLSTTVAFLLVLASVAIFVRYIDHMARSIRVSYVTTSVGDETAKAIDVSYPHERTDHTADWGERSARVIPAHRKGVVVELNQGALTSAARSADARIRVLVRVGDFVARGMPLFEVSGDGDMESLREEFHLGDERNLPVDPAFGFRQLVDIAERALSPGTVDPTTAVQALDQIHDLLRDLVQRPTPGARILTDDDGTPRVMVPQREWQDFLDLSVDEVAFHGSSSLQVKKRLRQMLEDLSEVASPDRARSIDAKLRDIEESWRAGSNPSPAG